MVALWLLIDFLLSPEGSQQELIGLIPVVTFSFIIAGLWYNKKWSYIPAALNIAGATSILVLILSGSLVLSEFFVAKFSAAYFIFMVLELSTIIFALKNYPLKDEFAVIESETK
jgi:hypothetical protein